MSRPEADLTQEKMVKNEPKTGKFLTLEILGWVSFGIYIHISIYIIYIYMFAHPVYYLRTFNIPFSLPRRNSGLGQFRSRVSKHALLSPPHYGTCLHFYREETPALSSLVDPHRIDMTCIGFNTINTCYMFSYRSKLGISQTSYCGQRLFHPTPSVAQTSRHKQNKLRSHGQRLRLPVRHFNQPEKTLSISCLLWATTSFTFLSGIPTRTKYVGVDGTLAP